MTAKHLLSEIVAGLDGVTPGEWESAPDDQWPRSFHVFTTGEMRVSVVTFANDVSREMGRRRIATLDHFALCSPDRIRAIAAYVERLEKALEPFAREADELAAGITDDCVYALPRFPDLGLTDFDVGDLRRARAALGGSNE